jgi:hypothetical protein
LTAHALRAWSAWLPHVGDALDAELRRAVARGVRYLKSVQRPGGEWVPLWFGNEGVLGEEKSLTHESFTNRLLDFPQYTRPAEFKSMSVPEVLLSGNHAEIEKWRHARQVEKTLSVRPDLLK